MKSKIKANHSIDFLFVMFIFLVFTFSVISSLLLALNMYRRIVDNSNNNSEARIAVSYVRELIRQNDENKNVSIDEFDGNKSLKIKLDGDYAIYIYHNNGALKEIYTSDNANLIASDGKEIVKLKSFKLEETSNGMLKIVCEDKKGDYRDIYIDVKASDVDDMSMKEGDKDEDK